MVASALSPKQARFVEEYTLDHNGAGAAVRAGYSPGSARVTASRLLTKSNIQAAVATLGADAAKTLNMTRERVLVDLQRAYEAALAQGEPMVMVLAAREVAKMCGFYAADKKAVAVKLSPKSRTMMGKFEAMTDDQLIAIIEAPEV